MLEKTFLPRAAIFMKVGYHSLEDLSSIVIRKREEEDRCGFFFWGYGGTVCHPLKQVQPFAEEYASEGLWLLMIATPSRFEGNPTRAEEFSVDNVTWKPLPSCALVTGSKYALVCQHLEKVNLQIDLGWYSIGIGPSKGKPLLNYLRNRVDKACGVLNPKEVVNTSGKMVNIAFRAKLVEPLAVFLR